MEAASRLLSVGVMMVCLLGDARLSSVARSHCLCPVIPLLKGTGTPPEDCRQVNSTFRYACLDGTVRKAGTSNRIKCQLMDERVQWERSSLICIDDPRRPRPQTTIKSTVPDDPRRSKPQTTIKSTVPADFSDNNRNTTLTSATMFSTSLHMNQSAAAPEEKTGDDVDEKLHGVAPPTTSQAWTVETPASSQGFDNMSISESRHGGETAAVSSVVLVLGFCAAIGVGYLLYRRRSRNNAPQHPVEELVPMTPRPT